MTGTSRQARLNESVGEVSGYPVKRKGGNTLYESFAEKWEPGGNRRVDCFTRILDETCWNERRFLYESFAEKWGPGMDFSTNLSWRMRSGSVRGWALMMMTLKTMNGQHSPTQHGNGSRATHQPTPVAHHENTTSPRKICRDAALHTSSPRKIRGEFSHSRSRSYDFIGMHDHWQYHHDVGSTFSAKDSWRMSSVFTQLISQFIALEACDH
ncbi:hypothetical protein BD410DRAFT_809893 [Rickenella mellea]|uniref:Uncharacterized protein n=1 Tax=Rickenella mellea TaxID=50990 RepID=A0A4Y7PFU3_9AGAM|nr:hypothetical protein BD410DRAFT_809893 [Rickenella mellea]